MKPGKNMTIGYVDAEGKTKKARITEVHSDALVTLDHTTEAEYKKGQNHHAHASFNEDKKTPNTWHFLSDGNGAAAKSEK